VTDKANCRENGFHCAANPLDCLTYYSNMDKADYYIVDARGDIHEDGDDSKIACTELFIIAKLSREEFFLHALAYMADHPLLKTPRYVSNDCARARDGYAIVRGYDPIAQGILGDILAFAKEDPNTHKVVQIALTCVDGKKALPNVWYGVDLTERQAG
jgi:hypothetical protein